MTQWIFQKIRAIDFKFYVGLFTEDFEPNKEKEFLDIVKMEEI